MGKNNEAVYTKVFVPKDEYDDAVERTSLERQKKKNDKFLLSCVSRLIF